MTADHQPFQLWTILLYIADSEAIDDQHHYAVLLYSRKVSWGKLGKKMFGE